MGTEAGTSMGTLACVSLEQLRGEPVDRRTGLFSFWLVLYEKGELAACRRQEDGVTRCHSRSAARGIPRIAEQRTDPADRDHA